MAKLQNTAQPIVRGITRPSSEQSRIVNLELHIPAGIGNGDSAFTPPMAGGLYLLSLWVHFFHCARDATIGGNVYITYGIGDNPTGGVISMEWTPIIQNFSGVKPSLYWCGVTADWWWTMRQRFENEPWRFGAYIENFHATEAWHAHISFEISEG